MLIDRPLYFVLGQSRASWSAPPPTTWHGHRGGVRAAVRRAGQAPGQLRLRRRRDRAVDHDTVNRTSRAAASRVAARLGTPGPW